MTVVHAQAKMTYDHFAILLYFYIFYSNFIHMLLHDRIISLYHYSVSIIVSIKFLSMIAYSYMSISILLYYYASIFPSQLVCMPIASCWVLR